MKKLVMVLGLAVAAVAVAHSAGFSIPFLSRPAASPEEAELARLEARFQDARDRFQQAGRAAGMAGIDTSSDAEAALRECTAVERAVAALEVQLPEGPLRERASQLHRQIAEFQRHAG